MPMSHEDSSVHVELIEGRARLPRIGKVLPGSGTMLPWVVVDGAGRQVEISSSLRERMLGDVSQSTCRSYAFDLLRWFRVLWPVDVGWEQATEAEVAALVGWLRTARNPQRERSRSDGFPAGTVNPKTGKPMPAAGYAPATIARSLDERGGGRGRGGGGRGGCGQSGRAPSCSLRKPCSTVLSVSSRAS
ncbi:MAG TPA: hypothetical protein VMQ38_04520 [Mycobacterium sp.]|nr:hypothetical protein [Mycobacterium sp.]